MVPNNIICLVSSSVKRIVTCVVRYNDRPMIDKTTLFGVVIFLITIFGTVEIPQEAFLAALQIDQS